MAAGMEWVGELSQALGKGLPMVGPLFTSIDIFLRLNASYAEVPPSLARLQERLVDFAFLMASIRELQPKHLALADLFKKAQEYLSDELRHQFDAFLVDYGRHSRLRKFIMSTRNEAIIRRMDDAVSKTVDQVNTLLQVEELYNLNNMSDSLRAVLTSLQSMPQANAKLVNDLEERVLGKLANVGSAVSETRSVLTTVNASVGLMSADLKALLKHMNQLPRYLASVRNTEVRDLWKMREWPDCIPIERFSRAIYDFVEITNPTMQQSVRDRVTRRILADVGQVLKNASHGSSYIAPTDLDRLIPITASLMDYFLLIEFGWLTKLEDTFNVLQQLLEDLRLERAKSKRLIDELSKFLSPALEAYPIPVSFKPNMLFLYGNDPDTYHSKWPPNADHLIMKLASIEAIMRRGQESIIYTATEPFISNPIAFDTVHTAMNTLAQPLLVEALGLQAAPADLISNSLESDRAQDEIDNAMTLDACNSVREYLKQILQPDSMSSLPTSLDMQHFFISMSDVSDVAELNAPPLIHLFQGQFNGLSVMIHPLATPIAQPIPPKLISYLHTRAASQLSHPHPALLHIHGLTIFSGDWALICELPQMPLKPLSVILGEPSSKLDIPTKLGMVLDIISAVEYMNSHATAISGLCSQAIVLDRKNNVKIIGAFDSAAWVSNADCILRYSAPETLNSNLTTLSSNVWGIGALLYALLANGDFLGDVPAKDVTKTLSGPFSLPTLPGCDGVLAEAYMNCLDPRMQHRPPLESLKATLEQCIDQYTSAIASAAASTQAATTRSPKAPLNGFESRTSSLYGSTPPSYYSSGLDSSTSNMWNAPAYPSLLAPRDVLAEALAVYQNGTGNVAAAIPLFEQAYVNNSQYDALIYLGDIHWFGNKRHKISKNYQLAYDCYYKATQHGLRLGHVGLADCYLFNHGLPSALAKDARLRQAEHHYQLAFRNNPQPTARLLCGLADLQYWRQQADSRLQYRIVPLDDMALEFYTRAHDLEMGYYRAQVGLADCCLARGQRAQAREIYLAIADVMNLRRVYIGLALVENDVSDRDAYLIMAEKAEDY